MFSDYCKFMGIEHHIITPLHPRANGLVENFNRMINKVIRTSAIERKCWKQEVPTKLSCDATRYHWEVSGRSIVSKQDVSGTITGVVHISEGRQGNTGKRCKEEITS